MLNFFGSLRPEPDMTVSEWADRYRILSQGVSSEPGPWRTSRTPYLKEIMDCLSARNPVDFVVFMKGSQIGATEAANNWAGYVIHHAPGYMLYVMPTFDMAKRSSRQKIAPMIEAVPEIAAKVSAPRSRDSGNSMLSKEFPGGAIVITGANSPNGLRSMSARYLYLDEVDGYPIDAGDEGDPIALAMRRTATFRRNRKVFITSTPTVKGASLIENYFNESDKRRYHVPCPHCEHLQVLTMASLCWTDGNPDTVMFKCQSCGALSPESAKTRMLERGRWIATSEGRYRGYHLSALYSPVGWYSWKEVVSDFLSANKGGPEKLKGFINTVLGETWDEEGESVEPTSLIARREEYEGTHSDVLAITMGVDVQKDRLEVEVVGWGIEEESWSLDYVILPGDTTGKHVWAALDDLVREWKPIRVAVDSGFNTQMVYDWVRRRKYAYAVKGMGGPGIPLIEDPVKRLQRLRRTNKTQISPEPIGTDQAKAILYSRLRLTTPGPGYCHFPNATTHDEEYFAQLTGEKLTRRFVKGRAIMEWVATRPRVEALDCRVYAFAALRLARIKLVPRAAKVEATPPVEKSRQRNFVTGWRT